MMYINSVLLALLCIIVYIYAHKLDKLLTIMTLNDTLDTDKEKPKKIISYNPKNFFNPYEYQGEDLDPVIPGTGKTK